MQYPGVRESIDSDVDNVAALLRISGLLPRELDIAPLLEAAMRALDDSKAVVSLLEEHEEWLVARRYIGEQPVTVNINGCPNSCARIQVADIGFKGQMVDDGDGPIEGFQVHLGGSLGLDSGFGRKLRQHKVLSSELGDYVERVVRNFVKQREQGERFATWALRADDADLR